MSLLLSTCGRALRDTLTPRMLALAIWPLLAGLLIWLLLAWLYWARWTQWVDVWMAGSFVARWLPHGLPLLAHYAAWLGLVLVLIPAVLATAGMLAALLVMPLIVGFVAARGYPALQRRQGGSVRGSFINTLVALAVFAALWLLTLPLWFTLVLGPPLALLLSAWLIQRLFRYDALAEHADAAEYRTLISACRGRFFLLGVAVALLYALPVVNLLAPIAGGLMFTHYALARLAELRAAEQQ